MAYTQPDQDEWLERQEEEDGVPQEGSAGRWYILDKAHKVIAGPMSREAIMYAFGWEGPTCSICDGLGHGYPGGGFCPLEDSGRNDPEPGGALVMRSFGRAFAKGVLAPPILGVRHWTHRTGAPDWSAAEASGTLPSEALAAIVDDGAAHEAGTVVDCEACQTDVQPTPVPAAEGLPWPAEAEPPLPYRGL